MKKFKTLLIVVMSLMINIIVAQEFTEISASLQEGNIQKISSQLDEKVEVSIMNDESYTKEEAAPLLDKFFSDKDISQYKPIHKGSTNGQAYYQIGELIAGNTTYRTYIYSKKIEGNYLIQEFRIEK